MPTPTPESASSPVALLPVSTPKLKLKTKAPSEKALKCFALYKDGLDDSDIAQRVRTRPESVRRYIQEVLVYMRVCSPEVLAARTTDVILSHLPNVDKVLNDLTNATVKDSQGNIEIDYATRRSMISALKQLREMGSPKEQKVNINQGNQTMIGQMNVLGRSFEERLRRKREERGLKNDVLVEARPEEEEEDPDLIDPEEEDDDDIEEGEFEEVEPLEETE